MTGVLVLIVFWLSIVGLLIASALNRIADAVQAQNRHYGIGHDAPAEAEETA